MSANLKGPFYISSLKVKKKIVTEQQAVSVNAHAISFQMVKNGMCYATATKRHFRSLDPTKTLKQKIETKIPLPLAAEQQSGAFRCNAGEQTDLQREPWPKPRFYS